MIILPLEYRRTAAFVRTMTALAVLTALTAGGCADDEAPLRPVAATCVVTGTAGPPAHDGFAHQIEFLGVDEVQYRLRVPLDDAGAYRVEVPAGDYVVSIGHEYGRIYLTPGPGVSESIADADTIRLGPENSPARIDLAVGTVRVVTDLPSGLVGMDLRVGVYRTFSWSVFPHLSDEFMAENVHPNNNGQVEIHSGPLVPGMYKFKLEWLDDFQYYGGSFWLPDAGDLASADFYRVGPDSLTTIPVAFTAAPARLTGAITGAWQAMGLNAPQLSAASADSEIVAGPWMVQESGEFALDLYRPEPVKLVITQGGVRHWIGGPDFASATLFDAQAGETIAGIDVTLSGLILRFIADIPGVYDQWTRVELRDPVDQRILARTDGRLNSQIGVGCLWPGDFQLYLAAGMFGERTWAPQWFDRAASPGEASLVTIPGNGGVLTLDVVIERGGSISGTVVSAAGAFAWNNLVATTADEAVVLGAKWLGGSRPDFVLTGLEDGSYKLGLVTDNAWIGAGVAPPEGTIWYPGTTDWSAATAVTISDGSVVSGLVLDVP